MTPLERFGHVLFAYALGIGLAFFTLLLGSGGGGYWVVLFVVAPTVVTFTAVGWLTRWTGMGGGGAAAHTMALSLSPFLLFVMTGAEGLGCAVIVLPLAVGPAVAGGILGFYAFRRVPRAAMHGVGLAPLLLFGSDLASPAPRDASVTTSIVVDAPPRVVWENVIRFPAIPRLGPGDDAPWTFALGYPQPVRCALEGAGVGSRRRCIFDEGVFDERVSIWSPGRELTFVVEDQPARIDDILAVTKGRFLLTALPDGRTRIDGTTWYRGLCAPHAYFEWWCAQMLHDIHERVLDHVKRLSEEA